MKILRKSTKLTIQKKYLPCHELYASQWTIQFNCPAEAMMRQLEFKLRLSIVSLYTYPLQKERKNIIESKLEKRCSLYPFHGSYIFHLCSIISHQQNHSPCSPSYVLYYVQMNICLHCMYIL